MTNRIANIIQWASIVIGITGMSFDKLISVQPIVSYILIGMALFAFAILVIVQFFYRDPNKYTGKQEVDLVWHRLLTGADRSVGVFAGDVSWAQSSKPTLAERSHLGVEARVVCRWPSTAILLEQVRALFDAGVQVKFYSDDLVKVRGLVVDTKIGLDRGTALTVVKHPKHRIALAKGQPGTDSLFDYEARRYVPTDDLNYIAMLHQLFDSIWVTLPKGIILTRLEIDCESLCKILSQISNYAHANANNITIRRVSYASLYSCCRTVKATKLAEIASLLEGYRQFKIDLFEPCRIESNGNHTLILPPIVEQQADGRLVVIDGMHRLYQLATHTDTQDVLCLVITDTSTLPSDPITFADVRISPNKKPREENFPNYKPEFFRDIKTIDRYLAIAVDEYSPKPPLLPKEALTTSLK